MTNTRTYIHNLTNCDLRQIVSNNEENITERILVTELPVTLKQKFKKIKYEIIIENFNKYIIYTEIIKILRIFLNIYFQ